MILKVIRSNRFLKDLEIAKRRGFNLSKLAFVVDKLANREQLEPKYKDHSLSGEYKDFRECHVQPDWLLIYTIDDEELELFLFRNGTHSDLFG